MVRVFLLACILFSLTASTASAQYFGRNKVQYNTFNFRSIQTEHFEIYFYPGMEEAAQDAARMAERWYQRHARTFVHTFGERKPIIFYANDADFQQTNIISGGLSEGVGGFTESLKQRVAMPLTGSYAATDHVLGHELVHSFQYDIALSNDTIPFNLGALPLWLIEGMAEYYSLGREDSHTAMWLRDAAIRDDLPAISQLNDFRYFPYRFGQGYIAYIGGRWGDVATTRLYRAAGRMGLDMALQFALGISADSLSNEWKAAVKEAYLPLIEGRAPVDSVGRAVLTEATSGGRVNVAPAISPDGRYIAFLSERDLFNINLFVADAQTGRIVRSLRETARNPDFDAIRFINSSGSWSPDGRRFIFVTFADGRNEFSIFNVETRRIERRIRIDAVNAFTNPSWSPDGRTIVFSGLEGGLSNLYLLDLQTTAVRQLTRDRYADLAPTWSPDGSLIAFVTDQGEDGTNFETLEFAPKRIGVYNVTTDSLYTIRPFGNTFTHNPQFSRDGRSLFFISEPDGFKDVYRMELATGNTYRVTRVQTGVSGITSLSPAMTVSRETGRMVFSIFSNNEYRVHALDEEETQGRRVRWEPVQAQASPVRLPGAQETLVHFALVEEQVATDSVEVFRIPTGRTGTPVSAVLPPFTAAGRGLIASGLSDAVNDLPPPVDIAYNAYSPRLKLDYVAPPTIGVGVGGFYGTQFSGGVGFFFSDMLGNHNLTVVAQANGTFKDIGGQAFYANLENRLNWGAGIAHIPYMYGGYQYGRDGTTGALVLDQIRYRLFSTQMIGYASYPFTTTRRVEATGGVTRYGFDYEVDRIYLDPSGRFALGRERIQLDAPPAIYVARAGGAYVVDFSNFAFTSPVRGGRARLGATLYGGTYNYATLTLDARRYYFRRPFTLAFRAMHLGNYSFGGNRDIEDVQDTRVGREYLYSSFYPTFVRGYGLRSFGDGTECQVGAGGFTSQACPVLDRLEGTRVAVFNAEIRLPVLGNRQFGLLNFPYLPTELSLFADAGLAWTGREAPVLRFARGEDARTTNDRIPVFSVGASTRVNVLGFAVLEIFYALPFQRPVKGAHVGFALAPGW